MSSRKRKQKPPEKFSEEKRTKMTWNMNDFIHVQATGFCDQTTASSIYSPTASTSDTNNTTRGLIARKKVKKQTGDRSKNIELNLENAYTPSCVCQLGLFNINLCTSKTQEAEVRTVNGATISSLTDELWITDCYTCVVVRLSFESNCPLPENFDLNSLNNGCLKHVSFKATVSSVSKDKLDALVYLQSKGVISLVLKPEQRILKDSWEVVVCLNESGLTKLPFASVDVTHRKIDKMMKVLMEWFFNFPVNNDLVSQECDNTVGGKGFDELYDAIKSVREKNASSQTVSSQPQNSQLFDSQLCHECRTKNGYNDGGCDCSVKLKRSNGVNTFDVQHPLLKPVLRGYQRRAVQWMLRKEQSCEHTSTKQGDADDIHPLWKEVHSLDGKVIYFNPYTGRLTKERFCLPLLPLGGILADEMGLGKTVEIIACILCHRKPSPEHKVLNHTAAAEQDSDIEQTSAETPLPSMQGSLVLKSTECDISYHARTVSVVTRSDQDRGKVDCSSTDISSSQVLPCSETTLTLFNGKSETDNNESDDYDIKTGPKESDNSTCKPAEQSSNFSQTSTKTQLSGIQDAFKLKSSECGISNHDRTISNASSPVHSDGKINCSDVRSSQLSSCSESTLALCNGRSDNNIIHATTVTKENGTTCMPAHTSNKLQSDQDITSTSTETSSSVEERAATIKCQCICGINVASCDDKLLQCCGCQAVLHAECLNYNCPGEFLCPHCAVNRPAITSQATLIISPAPIAQQWVDEIARHTEPSTLKLLVYEGVAKMGFIPPKVLADHDVILTTYATLRSDFYHLGSKQGTGGRSLRYDKRYVALPSPLTAVMFWRICLDEAQMVESTTAKAAEVALHLKSVHRWCVTGTPIQKGLEDIFGLLLFLGIDPYCHHKWWKTLLYEPYKVGQRQPLYDVLAKIMWRSAKKDVIHEIQLPDQDEKVKWLTFSPVEQHFYRRQHEECASTAMKMLSSWEKSDTKLSAIDRHTVHQLLNPLLRLRQACCHPQAVRGGYLSMQKSTLTMDKLLESLIAKAKLECEEAHRQLLFSFNGLAGVHILKKEWPEAVDMYREAMRSWTEHEKTFRTDALQKLHTLYNLSDVLSQRHPGCSNTLRDDKLQDEVKELKDTYTTRVNSQVTTAQQHLEAGQSSLAEIKQKVDLQCPWWIEALQSVVTRGMEADLSQRIKDELSSTDMELGSIGRFQDLHGLQYLISSKLDLIESTHNNLLAALDKLVVPPSSEMVLASAECCLRPAKDSHAERCAFCQVDDIFTEYESRIFGHRGMKGVDDQDLQSDDAHDWHRHGNTGGLRADSEVEKVLRVVHSFVKANKTSSTAQLQQEGRFHLNLIEGLRKEFKFLRALWFALHERISCLDELDMCTTRLRLLLPGEPMSDDIHVIHPLQVEQQRLKFVSDRVVAETELRKKLGQLLYLNNLAKTQTCHDGKNPEPCPVCTKQLGVQWSVFSCGHCICCHCAWVLLRQAGIGPRQRNVQVKCPMCRIPTLAQEISYVSTARSQAKETDENITVKGSHSTKVEAIVRTLLSIKLTDHTAKCLVFSTWQEVLGVLAKALEENGIKYRHITGSRHFQSNLHTFKQDPLVGVLLLPLQTGSNGLNIIEATHVLLVEPALNPAHELQAVGRVHRIGQTKPTHVYRFIIQGTVESRMYSLLQSRPSGCVRTGARDSENSSLTLGDLASLFTQDREPDDEQCMLGSFSFQEESEHSSV